MEDTGDYVVVNPIENGIAESEVYGPMIMCVEGHMRPPTQGVILSELVRGKHKYVYEVFGGKGTWIRPYYDKDADRGSLEEMERDKWLVWEECIAKLRVVFGEKVTIWGLDGSGKKGNKYRISFHLIMRQGYGKGRNRARWV
jgi:hypothetical protein